MQLSCIGARLQRFIKFILLTNDYKSPGQPLWSTLLRAPAFWMLLVMTGT